MARETGRIDILARLLGGAPSTRHPPAAQTALGDGEQELTYEELANRLSSGAARLAAAGIGRGAVVAVPDVRTLDTIVSCLALLAHGAAFLPVADPASMPDSVCRRLAAALAGPDQAGWPAGLRRVSLHAGGSGRADPGGNLRDGDLRDGDLRDGEAGDGEPRDGDPAYVMTTSGSTGEQKYAVVNRGGLRSMFEALHRGLEPVIPPGARWSQLHPLTFGYFLCEVLGCFAFAGELTVVARETPLTLDALLAATAADGPHVVCLTPSELTLLAGRLRTDPTRRLPSHLILSGEPAHKAPLSTLAGLPGGDEITVINTYAATETSGQITAHVVTAEAVPAVVAGLVGEVLPGITVTLRRDDGTALAPADHTSVGEICVSGPTLATGYLDAEQTRARFRRSPTTGPAAPDAIEYVTGDLGRWGPDGLYVLGRVNRTVKLGGRWVSLDAVERAIAASSLIDEVAITPDVLGDERSDCLRVVVRPDPAVAGQPDRVREQVVRRVPVRITVRLVVVDHLPRLPNGKVDLRALDTPGLPHQPAGATGAIGAIGAIGGLGGIVRGVWADLLGAGVRSDVNLFELGLDSLGVTAAAAGLSAALRREISPAFLLDHPRIDGQIAALGAPDAAERLPPPPAAGADRAETRRAARAEQHRANTAR